MYMKIIRMSKTQKIVSFSIQQSVHRCFRPIVVSPETDLSEEINRRQFLPNRNMAYMTFFSFFDKNGYYK